MSHNFAGSGHSVSITISGPAISAGTQSGNTGTIVFSNLNGVTFGMSNNSIVTASVAAGGGGAAISAGTQSVSTGTVVFSNSYNVTFGMSGSSQVTASASYSQSTAPGALVAGTQTATSGTLVFSDSNGISFGMSGSTRVTASYTVPTVPPETPFGVSAGTQSVSTGTLVFSDSNGISFGMSGSSRITASYTVPTVPPETPFGVSAGTQSVSTGTLIFSDSNNVSFGMSGSSRITASASYSQSTAPAAIAAGTQTATSGTILFSNLNGISFGMSGSTRITGDYAGVRAITAGTQSISNSTLLFSDGNGVSFGLNTGVDPPTFTASVAAGATATGNLGALAAGTQTATSGTVVFSDSNGISFGMSGSTRVTASYTVPTVPPETPFAVSAGTQSVSTGTAIFSDSNGISFGMSGSSRITASYTVPTLPPIATAVNDVASAGSTGTITRYAPEDHRHAGLNTVSIVGNTAGTTTAGAGSLVMAGGPNVTLSCATAAGGMTVSVSAPAAGAGTSIAAFSAGTQSVNSGTIILSNSNGISFGMANSATVTAQMPRYSWFTQNQIAGANAAATNSDAINLSMQRISVPHDISATRLDYLGHWTVAGSTAGSSTMRVAVYTFSNSTISTVSSTSATMSHAVSAAGGNSTASSNYHGQSGTKWRAVLLGTWNFTPGEYMIGFIHSANGPAGTTASATIYGPAAISVNSGSDGNANMSGYWGPGLYSAATGAFPASMHLSDINQTGVSVLAQPAFRMVGTF